MKIIFLLLFVINIASLNAAESLNRNILALFDSSELEENQYENSLLHKKMEVVFNHYGFKLVYVDVADGIPKELNNKNYMAQFTAIVTWFEDNNMKKPIQFANWLDKALRGGLKFIMMGNIGFLADINEKDIPESIVNKPLKHVGIKYFNQFYNNPLSLKILRKSEKDLIEFERELENEVLHVQSVKSISPQNKVHLSIEIDNQDLKSVSDVVISSERFIYAQTGFDLFVNPQTYITSWRINPFSFVKNLLVSELRPIPDTNTLCGRRIAYSHIDGDGFINVSNLDRKTYSGKIILDRIITKYKIPTTASIVVAEISPRILGSRQSVVTAREIFKNEYVEPASHTFSHPLSWRKEPTPLELINYLNKEDRKEHKGQILAYSIKDYKLDFKMETLGSLEYINKELTPSKSKAKVVLWSGSCLPPEEALKYTSTNGILNMNGGDSRMDTAFPSYSNLSGLYRKVSKYTQVYTSNANENLYTNLWTGPFSGFKDVIETFKNTEQPMRIKPMNVYYHFYSGEHLSSVKSLEDVYTYVLEQKPALTFASDYIKWIHGFQSSAIKKFNRLRYEFKNYGHLRTMRFEDTQMIPDYKKSKNIIGHRHFQGNLYVFLGGGDFAHLKLTDGLPNAPYISSCNGWVDKLKRTSEGLTIEGLSRTDFEFEVTRPDNKKTTYKLDGLGPFNKKVQL